MKTIIAAILVAAAGTCATLSQADTAAAGDFSIFGKPLAPMALAYAPEAAQDTRFDQFEEEADFDHELNDAWLGMPVSDADGKMIGFVEDAYLDEMGNVSELLVSLTGRDYAVYVGGEHAVLTDLDVAVVLSFETIAGLERAGGYQLVQR